MISVTVIPLAVSEEAVPAESEAVVFLVIRTAEVFVTACDEPMSFCVVMLSISSADRYMRARNPAALVCVTVFTNKFLAAGDGPRQMIPITPKKRRQSRKSAAKRTENKRKNKHTKVRLECETYFFLLLDARMCIFFLYLFLYMI